jgi:hypothetical protein
LDGFSDPNIVGQLSIFDLKREKWFESGTKRVAAQRGFYDYSPQGIPIKRLMRPSKDLEDEFPPKRDELLATNFANWRNYSDLFLWFA